MCGQKLPWQLQMEICHGIFIEIAIFCMRKLPWYFIESTISHVLKTKNVTMINFCIQLSCDYSKKNVPNFGMMYETQNLIFLPCNQMHIKNCNDMLKRSRNLRGIFKKRTKIAMENAHGIVSLLKISCFVQGKLPGM